MNNPYRDNFKCPECKGLKSANEKAIMQINSLKDRLYTRDVKPYKTVRNTLGMALLIAPTLGGLAYAADKVGGILTYILSPLVVVAAIGSVIGFFVYALSRHSS